MFQKADRVRSPRASDSAESSATTIERRHDRSIEFWNIHEVAVVPLGLRPTLLQPRIDRFAFQREHSEHALMRAAQRLTSHEPLERFQPEGELTKCE